MKPLRTQQQVYDFVKKKLLAQGKKSGVRHESGFSCLYRSNRTRACSTRCAIGHLLADEHYKRSFEDKRVDSHDPIVEALKKSMGLHKAQEVNTDFLADLQFIHDNYEPNEWEREFKRFAKDNKLRP